MEKYRRLRRLGRKAVSCTASAALAVMMVPAVAFAEAGNASLASEGPVTLDLSEGSIVISDEGYRVGSSGLVSVSSKGYVIKQTNSSTSTKNTITVTGGTQSITLDGVNINVSTEHNAGDIPCSFAITGGDVTLILNDNSQNTLRSGYSAINDIDVSCAGLWVKQGASLTISGNGQLDAFAGSTLYSTGATKIGNQGGGAGIGACSTDISKANKEYETVGSITIASGTVNATGSAVSYGGAGIGGGSNPSTITISGGTVTAQSTRGSGAAGIGGTFDIGARENASRKTIRISGGTVTATGSAAGIGGARTQPAYDISISGGAVNATSTGTGAGIGGGGGDYNGQFGKVTGGTISISGGSVTAQGKYYGAGIGGGGVPEKAGSSYGGGGSGNITISGGVVKATGGEFAPGIGGGSTAKKDSTKIDAGLLESIAITGGNVVAKNGTGYTANYRLNGVDTGIGHGMNPGTYAQEKYSGWKLKGAGGRSVLEKKTIRTTSNSIMVKRNAEEPLTVAPAGGTATLWLVEGCYQFDSNELYLVSEIVDEETKAINLIDTLNNTDPSSDTVDVKTVQGYEAAYNALSEGARYYVDSKVNAEHTIAVFKDKLKEKNITVQAVLDSNGGSAVATPVDVQYWKEFDLGVPERENWVFQGWYQGETEVTGPEGTGVHWPYLAESTTLTARWASEIAGTGTSTDPYVLKSASNLVALSKISNGVNTDEELSLFGQAATRDSVLNAHYKLDDNLTISTGMGFFGITGFTGTFDGNGKTIELHIDTSGIVVREKDPSVSGTNDGKVCVGNKNGTGDDVYIQVVGGLFNSTSGATIKNLKTAGNVKLLVNSGSAGVFAGSAANTKFVDCTNGADLSFGATFNTTWAGGFVGNVSGSSAVFENCTNTGDVTAGDFANSIGNSCAAGFVSLTQATNVELENCHNTGDMTAVRTTALSGRTSFAAGLAALGLYTKNVTMEGCTNSGAIVANADFGNTASGLCVFSSSVFLTMQSCENKGSVSATDGYASLLCGSTSGASGLPADTNYDNCSHVMTGTGEYADYVVGKTASVVSDGKTTIKVPVASNADNYYSDDRFVSQNGVKVADIASSDFHKVYNDFSVNGNVLKDSYPFQSWESAYTIASVADYRNLVLALRGDETAQNKVLNGKLSSADSASKAVALSSIYVKVTDDITLSDVSVIGLGTAGAHFGGKIDGQNHTVTYAIDESALSAAHASNIGFIGYSQSAEIKNLRFEGDVVIVGDPANGNNWYVGAAVANGSGAVIENCHSSVDISASRTCTVKNATGGFVYAGGLIGSNTKANVSDSSYLGSITVVAPKNACAGGIAASLSGNVSNCTSKCNITSTLQFDSSLPTYGESAYTGGLIGTAGSVAFDNCVAAGKITAKNTVPKGNNTVQSSFKYAYAGGLVGQCSTELSVNNCKAFTTELSEAAFDAAYACAGAFIGKSTSSPAISGTNWYTKIDGIAEVPGANAIDTTVLASGTFGESKPLFSGALPSGVAMSSEVASLNAATGSVVFTKATSGATGSVALLYEGQEFFRNNVVTVSQKALTGDSGNLIDGVVIAGINNSYASDDEATKADVRVVYNGLALKKDTDYSVALDADKNVFKVTFIGNYAGAVDVSYSVPDAPVLTASAEGYEGVYDGTTHGIKVSADEAATITYCATENGTYAADPILKKDAGAYVVYWKAEKVVGEATQTVSGSAVINIAKRPLTITAENQSMYVGGTLPTKYGYKVDGLVDGERLTTEPSFSCAADGKTVGSFKIEASGADAGSNYTISYVSGTLTVSYYYDPTPAPKPAPEVGDKGEGIVIGGGAGASGSTTVDVTVTDTTATTDSKGNKVDGAVSIDKIETSGTSVAIPETVTTSKGTFLVTSIPAEALKGNTAVESVSIPASVTAIGASAFEGCTSLASVNVPAGVTAIAASTFAGCTSLESVEVAGELTSIAADAFNGCSKLTNLTTGGVKPMAVGTASSGLVIPASVAKIGDRAFKGTGITGVTLPAGVKMGTGVFRDCRQLTKAAVESGVKTLAAYTFKGCSKLKSVTLPSSVTKLERSVFSGCSKLGAVTLGSKVASIGKYAFYKAGPKTLVVKSKKLTKSGVKSALKGSNVTSIKVQVSSSKKVNKSFAAKYASAFAKANSGKKVKVTY